MEADLVLVTHDHFDHNAVSRISGHPRVLDEPGLLSDSEYSVQVINGHHARFEEYHFDKNLIFVLEMNGVRFCHLGDNDANITDDLMRQLGRVDLLMIEVDESEHLLSLDEVSTVGFFAKNKKYAGSGGESSGSKGRGVIASRVRRRSRGCGGGIRWASNCRSLRAHKQKCKA